MKNSSKERDSCDIIYGGIWLSFLEERERERFYTFEAEACSGIEKQANKEK